MSSALLQWILFNVFVIIILVLDLGVFNKTPHEVKPKEALFWTVIWIVQALLFNLGIYYWQGAEPALQFLTGYVIEKSLSVDNIFVFLIVFSYFRVEGQYQHKVLFWGIIGALLMRGAFIAAGVTLLEKFDWIVYVFGGFLILTGIRFGLQKNKDMDPGANPVLRLFRRIVPVTDRFVNGKFFVKIDGRRFATPLFVALVAVETTDLIFAVDSIPAILAITTDPFIVYTSNVFALLGLRALFFALANMMRLFHYLQYGLGVILVFIGVKMVLATVYKIPVGIALGVIAGVLLVSVIVSVLWPPKEESPAKS